MTLDEFRDYFRQHADQLRAAARRMLARIHGRGDAGEAVNQAFLQLYRRYEQIQLATAERYVLTVLRNVVRDMGRAQARTPAPLGDELAGQLASPESDDGDSTSIAECEAAVCAALVGLTPLERQAFRLYLAGDRAAAIQQMAGYDATASRARKKFRELLGGQRDLVLRLGMARIRELADEPTTGA
jgi:RNA polymerase sigma factor (sigma-70 family)